MRRFHALLIAAGLAAMPALAAAKPSNDSWSTPQIFERYEWSMGKARLGVTTSQLSDPAWSTLPQWLREMMKPLVVPDETGTPEPLWFREPLHPTKPHESSLHS